MKPTIAGLLLLFAMGCGGGHENSGLVMPASAFTLTVSPDGLNIPAGGGGQVLVTATRRSGFDEAITLSLEGAPSGVVGQGTVATGAQSGRLVLLIAAEAAPQDLRGLRVKGMSGSLSQFAAFHLVVAPPLPAGEIRADQVQAAGGIQTGGSLENEAVVMEPTAGMVATTGSGEETRYGFDPSTP